MNEKKRDSAHRTYDTLTGKYVAGNARGSDTTPLPKASGTRKKEQTTHLFRVAQRSNTERMEEMFVNRALRDDRQEQQKARRRIFPVDGVLFMLIIGLLCFGIIMMYSASYAWSINDYGHPYHFLRQQLICAGIGLVGMVIAMLADYNILRAKNGLVSILFFVATLALLLLVPFVGKTANGAKRWIQIGSLFSFQPSEIAKFGVILILSWYYSCAGVNPRKFHHGILPLVLVLGPVVALVALQKHISAILLICMSAVVVVFVAGTKWWHLALPAGIGAGGLVLLVKFSDKFVYVLNRIKVWRDPFSDAKGLGYQTIQSLYAIASGGLFGLGLGQSRQKQLYLPEAHNDYVFSIVCEELGMVGAILVLLLFLALIIRGYWIAVHAADKFGCLLATGITTLIALQTMMNIAVVTNAMPVTGISLPFFSYGGTSLIILLAEMGVLLSVSRQMRLNPNGK